MSAITAAPARTEEEAVAYGWRVFRAAQGADWPQEHACKIYPAFTKLSTELILHGRLADDEWARDAAPDTRAAHAQAALERAAELLGLLERYCGGVMS